MTKERCEIRASFCNGIAVQRRQLSRQPASTPFHVCLGCHAWMDRQGIATCAATAAPPGPQRSPRAKVRR